VGSVIRREAEMNSNDSFLKSYLLKFLSLLLLAAPLTSACLADDAIPAAHTNVDDAQKTFARLDEYMKNNSIQFSTTYDAQNVSLGTSRGTAHFFIERPNLLRIEFSGAGFSYLMISDGKVFTIYDENTRKYAQQGAPEKPIQAVNLFTGLAALQARVLQFWGLVGDIASSDSDIKVTKTGVDRVGGLTCARYEIQYVSGVDSDQWTAWLRDDGVPLPCKTFIKSPDEGSQQTNLYDWASKLSPSGKFNFTPPAGSAEVDVSKLNLRPLQ
jgi:hypothetical protein